jgi:hypothetical protein
LEGAGAKRRLDVIQMTSFGNWTVKYEKVLILVSILYGFGNPIYPNVLGELLSAKVGYLNGALTPEKNQFRPIKSWSPKGHLEDTSPTPPIFIQLMHLILKFEILKSLKKFRSQSLRNFLRNSQIFWKKCQSG